MANVDAPRGLQPIRYRSGAPYNGACNLYYFPSTDATAAFIGDAVTFATTFATAEEGAPMVVQAAAAATNIVGVVVGFKADTNADTTYRAASTGRYAFVADDPNLVFETQHDGTMSPSQIWYYGDIVVGTGSTITCLSAMELQTSSLVTTTAQLKIVRVVARPDNTATDANADVEVIIHEHALKDAAL